jgi:hypothetical protein
MQNLNVVLDVNIDNSTTDILDIVKFFDYKISQKIIDFCLIKAKKYDQDVENKILTKLKIFVFSAFDKNKDLMEFYDLLDDNLLYEYPKFNYISLGNRIWSFSISKNNYSLKLNALISFPAARDFFWNDIEYQSICRKTINELAHKIKSTKSVFFEDFGHNYDSVSTLYENNLSVSDFESRKKYSLDDFIFELEARLPPLEWEKEYGVEMFESRKYSAYLMDKY